MFGLLPARGLFVRHARNLSVDHFEVTGTQDDDRPALVLMDVAGAEFAGVKAQRAPGVPLFVLHEVSDFSARDCPNFPDAKRATAMDEAL
jgi:hypothetical protein